MSQNWECRKYFLDNSWENALNTKPLIKKYATLCQLGVWLGAVYSSILKDNQIKNKNSFLTNFIWNVILLLFWSIISREEKNIFTTYVLHTPCPNMCWNVQYCEKNQSKTKDCNFACLHNLQKKLSFLRNLAL